MKTTIRCDICIKEKGILVAITAGFGFPGNKEIRCGQHKTTGMLHQPRKKCIIKNCKEIALYGITKQLHCEDHKEKREYNLIEKECFSCKLVMILYEDNLCYFCNPKTIKTFRLSKQKEIKSLLDLKKYKYTIYDKIIDSKCGLERPDFLFDCGTYFVVLEVDENQHKQYNKSSQDNNQYDCDTARMINISQSLGMKTIFIRYNPDEYKVNGIKQYPTKNRRYKELLIYLNSMLSKKYEELEFLSVVYLFYDEYDFKNVKLETILKNET